MQLQQVVQCHTHCEQVLKQKDSQMPHLGSSLLKMQCCGRFKKLDQVPEAKYLYQNETQDSQAECHANALVTILLNNLPCSDVVWVSLQALTDVQTPSLTYIKCYELEDPSP